jgi:hypothetical protein
MKRCPQCNQFATDDALAFCRADGVRLVEDSGSFSDMKTVALLPDAHIRLMLKASFTRASTTTLSRS